MPSTQPKTDCDCPLDPLDAAARQMGSKMHRPGCEHFTADSWAIRRELELRLSNQISNGPGDNFKAAVRCLRIMDFVRKIDGE